MKKTVSIILIILIIGMCVFFSGCHYKKRMLEYYSDDLNYETLEVKVNSIEEEYMEVEFLYDVHVHYTYSPFRLIDMPTLHTKVKCGDIINIIVAPRYFWDSYNIPIVGITKDDVVYLEFETGKQNLLDYIERTE